MKRLFLICILVLVGKLLFADDGWGVIAVMESDGLNTKGFVASALNGGERFIIKKEVKVEGEKAYYVTFFDRKKQPSYIVMAKDCFVSYDVLPDKKDDPDGNAKETAKRKEIVEYYSKYATRERLRQRALDRHRKKSPYATLKKEEQKLAQISKAMATLNDRIEKNAAARKKAEGANHIRLVEEGRELRAEQGALPKQYDTQKEKVTSLKEKVQEWDAAHPFNESSVTQSAMWKKLTLSLEEMTEALTAEGVELVNPVHATKDERQ